MYACTGSAGNPCSRSVNAEELTAFVESRVLGVFSRPDIADLIATSHPESTELAGYRQALTEDRERLMRVDDDYYDNKVDRAAWLRQRSRLLKRIEANQRICNTFEVTVNLEGADLTKTAAVWPTMGPAWKHDATKLLIDRILIDAHPIGTARTAMRYRGESADQFSARRRALREEILGRRVRMRWSIDVEGSKLAESNVRSRTVSSGLDR